MKALRKRLTTLTLFLALCAFTLNAQPKFEISEGLSNNVLKLRIEANVNHLLQNLNECYEHGSSLKLQKSCFTKEGLESIRNLWDTSRMMCPMSEISSACLKTSSGYQVRGIAIDMAEADNDDKRQELTIDFTSEGTISFVNLTLGMHRYDELMGMAKDDNVDYTRRQIIIDFLENFRTAYNRKDIDFISKVFSDWALIITGHIVREQTYTDMSNMLPNKTRVVYHKQTKAEYINRLRSIFKRKKFVNVKFDDIHITKHPKYDDIYGINLVQYWRTDTYHDEGYLFLFVDFRDNNNPLIRVRTWQPIKDQNGNIVTNPDDVYDLGSFPYIDRRN